jgi:ketosteroid isomerase-like protein
MPTDTAKQFADTLQRIEKDRDPAPLVELFSDDAELENLTDKSPAKGRDGASRFWRKYLDSFGEVRSHFTRTHQADGVATLEWVSEGTLPNGHPIHYRGVSVLEISGDRVQKFRTYYDSAAFLSPAAETDAKI